MNRILPILVAVFGLVASGSAFSDDKDRSRRFESGFGKRQTPPLVRGKGCEAFGKGFRESANSSFCVKVFGSIRSEVRRGQPGR